MSNEVRMLDVCRTLGGDTVQSFFDPFDGTAMNPTNWSAGGWTAGGVADSGLPLVSDGIAYAGGVNDLAPVVRTAKLTSQALATVSYREISVAWVAGYLGYIYLYLDMSDSLPNPNIAGYMLVAVRTGISPSVYKIQLLKDQMVVADKEFSTAPPLLSGNYWVVRLSIDTAETVRAYWESTTTPSLIYQPPSYTAAGGQVGFAIRANTSGTASRVDWLKTSYNLNSGLFPSQMLVESKNGSLFYQSTNGQMIELNTALSLASDRWLSAAARLQSVFIADFATRTQNRAGGASTSAGASGQLTDNSTGVNFVTAGVSAIDDMLEITDGTWSSGTGEGTYPITTVAANVLTISGTIHATATGSAVSYRVVRAPKVFNSTPLTLTRLTATVGFVPPGCNIVTACFDRIIWAGDDNLPEAVYFSKVGDPTNYNYGSDTTDQASIFDPARSSGSAYIGDKVTALIPHLSDYLVIGCKRSTYIQRGDPGLGNAPEVVTREVGILGQSAWCYTPEGYIVAMSQDGLYQFAPLPNTAPSKISRDRLPAELTNINTELADILLAYDIANEGIHIFVTPRSPGPTSHWWFGWRTKDFQLDSYASDHEPTAITTHTIDGQGSPAVVLGCRDGFLRVYSDGAVNDDGANFGSFILIGPIALGASGYHDGILREVIGQLALGSGNVTLEVQVGDSVESAFNAAPRDAFTLRAGKNLTHSPRLRGNACFLRLSSTGGTAWAMEQLSIVRESLGKQRLL